MSTLCQEGQVQTRMSKGVGEKERRQGGKRREPRTRETRGEERGGRAKDGKEEVRRGHYMLQLQEFSLKGHRVR